MYQRQVSFQEAVERALKVNYCNFSDRASRSEFWWYILFTFIVGVVLVILQAIVGQNIGQIISCVVNLALFLPSLGLCVRRLHDLDKSGWWVLLGLVPLVNLILIYWFCQNSQMADNEYGPVPNMTV